MAPPITPTTNLGARGSTRDAALALLGMTGDGTEWTPPTAPRPPALDGNAMARMLLAQPDGGAAALEALAAYQRQMKQATTGIGGGTARRVQLQTPPAAGVGGMGAGPTVLTPEDTTNFKRGGILRDGGVTPARTGGETDVGGEEAGGHNMDRPSPPLVDALRRITLEQDEPTVNDGRRRRTATTATGLTQRT